MFANKSKRKNGDHGGIGNSGVITATEIIRSHLLNNSTCVNSNIQNKHHDGANRSGSSVAPKFSEYCIQISNGSGGNNVGGADQRRANSLSSLNYSKQTWSLPPDLAKVIYSAQQQPHQHQHQHQQQQQQQTQQQHVTAYPSSLSTSQKQRPMYPQQQQQFTSHAVIRTESVAAALSYRNERRPYNGGGGGGAKFRDYMLADKPSPVADPTDDAWANYRVPNKKLLLPPPTADVIESSSSHRSGSTAFQRQYFAPVRFQEPNPNFQESSAQTPRSYYQQSAASSSSSSSVNQSGYNIRKQSKKLHWTRRAAAPPVNGSRWTPPTFAEYAQLSDNGNGCGTSADFSSATGNNNGNRNTETSSSTASTTSSLVGRPRATASSSSSSKCTSGVRILPTLVEKQLTDAIPGASTTTPANGKVANPSRRFHYSHDGNRGEVAGLELKMSAINLDFTSNARSKDSSNVFSVPRYSNRLGWSAKTTSDVSERKKATASVKKSNSSDSSRSDMLQSRAKSNGRTFVFGNVDDFWEDDLSFYMLNTNEGDSQLTING